LAAGQVDGNKKVDCQRLPDKVGEDVGTKERSGGGWGGINPCRIFTSLHGQRGAVMRQRGRGSARRRWNGARWPQRACSP
jgi:hypothetical protein